MAEKTKLVDKRCHVCNSLLCRSAVIEGIVQIKCKCGALNTLQAKRTLQPEGQYESSVNELVISKVSVQFITSE
jgi:phage FluMu protein Com